MPSNQDHRPPRSAESDRRVREYHRIVLDFGREVLGTTELDALLQRASEHVSQGMHISRSKILEYRPETDDLLVRAGIGWHDGAVGHATLPSDMASPPGRTYRSGKAVYVDDLPASAEYEYSDLLREHGIVSLINVPIIVEREVWGVLEVDSERKLHFDADDEEFLAGFAGFLGSAIEKRRRDAADASAHLERTVELREREALFRELQHRVANNLQTIVGFLEIGSRRVSDPVACGEFDRLVDRVASILSAHEQLSLGQVEKDISLGLYITDLARNMRGPENVQIIRTIDGAPVPLRTAVRLGMILNELVTNCSKHAFDANGGIIRVTLSVDVDQNQGRLVVADNGRGLDAARSGGKGTALVTSFVEQIGGSVSRTGGPGEGTSVTVTFPLISR